MAASSSRGGAQRSLGSLSTSTSLGRKGDPAASGTLSRSRLLPVDNVRDGAPSLRTTADQHMLQGKPASGGHLSVFPAAVEFTGVQPGTEYSATLRIQNTARTASRIRVVPPTAPGWLVEFQPRGQVAPGLEVACTVRFVCPAGGLRQTIASSSAASLRDAGGEGKDDDAPIARPAALEDSVMDRLVVVSGSSSVEIPLRALPPAPMVRFTPLVDFGTVTVGRKYSQTLWLTNVGNAVAPWSIELDGSLPVRVSPPIGEIPADAFATDLDRDGALSLTEQAIARRAGPKVPVTFEFEAEQEGVFRALATLSVRGQPPQAIDVAANVIDHAIEVVLPDSRGPLASLRMKPCFFGSTTTVRAILVNNGPAAVSVKALLRKRISKKLLQDLMGGAASRSTLGASSLADSVAANLPDEAEEDDDDDDPVALARKLMMDITPKECEIPAFKEREVVFTFKPVDTKPRAPFKVQSSRAHARLRRRVAVGQLEDDEAADEVRNLPDGSSPPPKTHTLRDSGRIRGKLGLPPTTKRSDPRAMTLTKLRGEQEGKDEAGSPALPEEPLDPTEASLLAGPSEVDVITAQLAVVCEQTSQQIIVDVRGEAVRPSLRFSRKTFSFGDCAVGDRRDVQFTVVNPSTSMDIDFAFPNVAHFDFQPKAGTLKPQQSKQVIATFRPASLGTQRRMVEVKMAGGLGSFSLHLEGDAIGEVQGPKRAVPRSVGAPPQQFEPQYKFVSGDKSAATKAKLRKEQMPLPWEEESGASMDATVAAAAAAATAEEGKRLHDETSGHHHRQGYVDYLRQSAARRNKAESVREMKRTGRLTKWNDPVSLGMLDPKAGLDEPDPGIPAANEPLWLAHQIDADGKLITAGRSTFPGFDKLDPCKLIKTKFKPEPTTQAEVVDCAAELADEALSCVRATPKRLNFGETNVFAKMVRSFAVFNGTARTILVEIEPPEDAEELHTVHPRAQVIPSGKLAGFDIHFEPKTAGEFEESVIWRINRRHAMRFQALASVNAVELRLSETELHFNFDQGSDDKAVSKEFTLTNDGQAAAEFQWRISDGTAFSLDPIEGAVPPNGGKMNIRATFRPIKGLSHKGFAALLVRGGAVSLPPPKLALVGQPHAPDLQLVNADDAVIRLGHCAVGVGREVAVSIVNKGRTAAVYNVNPELLPPGVLVDPPSAQVPVGATMMVTLTIKPRTEAVYDPVTSAVVLEVRGGDNLKLGMEGEAVMPDVSVVEPEIAFGEVAVGGTARRRITLHNKSIIPAEITVDLEDYPEFTLAAPLGLDPDDAASVAGESVFQAESVADDKTQGEAEDEGKDEHGSDDEGEEKDEKPPTRFKLRVAPKGVLPVDLIFSPQKEGSHAFPLPLTLAGSSGGGAAGAMKALRRLVTAEALRPRLKFSTTRIDFGHRVMHSDLSRRVPYSMSVNLTNTDDRELSWAFDVSSLMASDGSSVFQWVPTSGVLAPGETDSIRVLFNPSDLREFSARVPVYLDGALHAVHALGREGGSSSPAMSDGTASDGMALGLSGSRPDLAMSESQALLAAEAKAEAAAAAAAARSKKVASVNPYLHVELHGVGVHPQLTFDRPEVVLPPVPLRTMSHARFFVEGHGFDMLRLKYRVLSDSHPEKIPLRLYFPRGDSVSLARPRIPVIVTFEAPRPMAFTTMIEFTDGDLNKYRVPVTGVTDSSILTVHPFVAAYRDEYDFVAKPRLPPVFTAAFLDTDQSLIKAGAVAAPRSRAAEGSSARSRGSARGKKEETGAVVIVDVEPVGDDGEPLPHKMREQVGVDPAEVSHLLRWLNSVVFRSPIRRFPDDLVALNGRPLFEFLESMTGKPVPGQAPIQLPANSRMRASVLYKQARELLAFVKAQGGFVHNVRAEDLLNERTFVRIRRAVTGATGFGGPATAPMLPVSSPAEKLKLKRVLRKSFPAKSLSAWATVVLQSVKVFLLPQLSVAALFSTPGMMIETEPAALAAQMKIQAAEHAAEAEKLRLEEERKRGRGDGGGGGEEARIRSIVGKAKKQALAADPALTKSNVFNVNELVLARWLSYHHNRAFPKLPRRVVDFQRDLRDGVVVAGVLLNHCPFLGEEGWPLNREKLHMNPVGDEEIRSNWELIFLSFESLQLLPPFDASAFLGKGASAVPGESANLRAVAEARDAADRLAAKKLEAEEAKAREARLLASRTSNRSGSAPSESVRSGVGASSRGRGHAEKQEAAIPEGPMTPRTAAAALAADELDRELLDRLNHDAESALAPGLPRYAVRDVRVMFETGGILAHEDPRRPFRMPPGEGALRTCLLNCLWMFRSLPGVVPKAKIEFACALGTPSRKAIELTNPSDTPITYTAALEPLGNRDDASVFGALDTEVTVPARGTANFVVVAKAKFSRQARARLTFHARRDSPGQALPLVFDLVTMVAARPPVEVVECSTPLYSPANVVVNVTNPYSKPAKFALRIIPLPADAPVGCNVPETDIIDPTDLEAARTIEEQELKASVLAENSKGGKHPRKRRGKGVPLKIGQWPGVAGEAGPLTGTGRWPAAFWCKVDSVALKPGASKKLAIQFLPFVLGQHACAVELCDPKLGEVLYEVRGVGAPPVPLATLRFSNDLTDEIVRDVRVCAENPAVERALDVVLQRLDRGAQQREQEARRERQSAESHHAQRRRARSAAREARQAVAAFQNDGEVLDQEGSKLSAHDSLSSLPLPEFVVDVDSPWWDVMEESYRIPDPPLPAWASSVARSKGGRRTSASAAATELTGVPEGAFVVPGVATLETPTTMRDPAALHVTLRPKAAGAYKTLLVLTSARETRVYEIEGTISPPSIRRELELRAPVGDSVSQAIPIVNSSSEPWIMQTSMELLSGPLLGSHSFKFPATTTVHPGKQGTISVTFSPTAEGTERTKLKIHNASRSSMPDLVILLTGVATQSAPFVELSERCKARDRVVAKLRVPNTEPSAATYDVQVDLPFLSGQSTVQVPGASRSDVGTALYELSMRPLVEGTFTGTVTFTNRATKAVQWASVDIVVDPPDPVDVIHLESLVREAVAVSVEVTNPLDVACEYDIDLRGKGLVGDPLVEVGPNGAATYDFLFCPLVPGKSRGSLMFSHPEAGEVWYELAMDAHPAPAVDLPPMTAAVGRRDRIVVPIDNPTRTEATVRVTLDNSRNFAVEPDQFTLLPYSKRDVAIVYTPSSVGSTEAGTIRLVSDHIGEWTFHVRGTGDPPGVMGEPVALIAPAGLTASTSVPFRNPFPEALQIMAEVEEERDTEGARLDAPSRGSSPSGSVHLPPIRGAAPLGASSSEARSSLQQDMTKGGVFELLKAANLTVPPFAVVQIPLSFSPPAISEHKGKLMVHVRSKGLTWTYPLRGVAEAPPSKRVLRFHCKARERTSKDLELKLPGLFVDGREEFHVELQVASEIEPVIRHSVAVEVVDAEDIRGPEDPLTLRVHMHPAKPFRARGQLVVAKASGGRWRWECHLEADDPDPDDTIRVEAELGNRSSVAIALSNSSGAYAAFRAGFTLDSAQEFTVTPAVGELPPEGEAGAPIVIHFTPQEYGKTCHGRLIVETEEDQWVYDVVGTQPRYHRPHVTSTRVDTRLDRSHLRAIKTREEARATTNFLKVNAAAARTFTKKEAKGFHM
jgi:hypothetical protein